MTIVVPDGYKSLEPRPLASHACFCTSTALNLVHWPAMSASALVQSSKPHPWGASPEKGHDLRLPDGHGGELDLPQGRDVYVLNPVAQVGDRELLLVLGLASGELRGCSPDVTAAASHSRALRASGPSCCTGIIHHLVFSWRRRKVEGKKREVFIYLNGRAKREQRRGGRREREIFNPLVHSQNGCSSQFRARPKPPSWVAGAWVLGHLPVLPRCISRRLPRHVMPALGAVA